MKGLSGIIDGLKWLTGGNFNLGTTLFAFLSANTLRKYNMWPFGDGSEANKNVETLTKEIEQLKKANEELLVDEQKTSNIFTKNKYKNQRKKNEKKIAKKEKDLAKQQAAELAEASKATPEQQEEIAESFDIKKIQSRKGGKANALKQRRAKLASQGKTEAEIAVDPKVKQYTKDIEDCDKKIADYNQKLIEKEAAEKSGVTTTQRASNTTKQNADATQTDSATTSQNTITNQQNASSNQQAANAENVDTIATENNIVATQKDTYTTNQNTISNQKNAKSFKSMAQGVLKMAASMAIIQGVMQLFDLFTWGVNELVEAYKEAHKSYEDLHEDFEVMNSDLEEQKSELQSLESEFDTIQDQIIEIQSLGSLSFTKQEELDKLKAQSAELERQIELQKIITQNQQGKTNDAALKAAEAYLNTSAETNKTLTETQEEGRETGENWGKLADAILMIGGGVMVATGFLAPLGAGLMIAGMAGVGKGIGGEIGEGVATSDYNDDQTKREQIENNNYKATREVLTKAVEDAGNKLDNERTDKNIKAYNLAVEKLSEFDNNTAETIGQLQEYISSTDYSTLSPEQKETYKKINEYINEYMLANGGSTINAANSILGYDEYKGQKYLIEDQLTKLKRGDITEDAAATEIERILNSSPALRAELEALGLTISGPDGVVAAFTELGEKLKEDAKLMDSLNKVSAVTSAFDDLGNAVKEFQEDGRASTGTLESLNEKFGELDEFEGLYKVLATGDGNLEKEISNVANAYIGQVGALSGLTEEEEKIMVERLKALGVLNAQEVLDARQTAQDKLKVSGLAYGVDLTNYGNAEQAKLAIATAAGLSYADINEDNIKGLAESYGIDLKKYADTEQAKIAIAEARAREEAKLAYDNGDISKEEYDDRVANINSFINGQNTIDNILSGFETELEFNINTNRIGIGSDYDEDPETKAEKEANEAFQKAMDYRENRIAANQAKYDQIQNDIDWLESQGKMADANYYKDQIALMTEGEESKTAFLNNKLAEAEKRMRELETAGKEGSDEWWEAAGIYNDTLSELDDVRDTVIDLQDAIGEVEWSQFEEFNTRLDDINSKLETMRDLIAPNGEEDWFDDEGNWTEKGVAVLGSYIQSLEYYKQGLNEANDALTEFNKIGNGGEWANLSDEQKKEYVNTYGIHSEQEYYDYLKKLTDEQYNYASSVSDTQQEIADMYESSINAAEEYITTLVEGYQDYIDVVKESLDAERDLYNFKKDVQKQTKDIGQLERRIAALSGSTNASDVAERRKLEAELAEQREALNDTYYEHSMDSQQEALDKEAEAYEEAMNKFVENLRTNLDLALEDMDSFIEGVTAAVTANAPTILSVYESLDVALDSAIVAPWQEAKDAMTGYTKEDGLGLMNSWVAEGGVFDAFATNATTYLTSIWSDANVDPNDAFAGAVTGHVEDITESIRQNVETAKGYLRDLYDVADTSKNYTEGNYGDDGNPPPGKDTQKTVAKETKVDMLPLYLDSNGNVYYKVQGMSDAYVAKSATVNKSGILYAPKGALYYSLTEKNLKKKASSPNTSSGGSGGGRNGLTATMKYAKGTIGTTEDQWAITDEPWLGDELVMVPTAQGNLSYMRKGTSVVPADITANLVEWGKLNPDMMKVGGGANINMISNAVNKPELNFEFDSLVHVDNCSQDTLKDLEKMVDNKINQFSKQMNYAIKRIGGR